MLGMASVARTVPPTSFFLIGAVFPYLGPALAVLLFAHVAALGVMWLRIALLTAVRLAAEQLSRACAFRSPISSDRED